jgi:hypothetical protein
MSERGTVETEVRDGVLWIRVAGTVLFQTALAAMKAAAEGARSHGTDRLMFDIRSGSYPDFEASTLESARRAGDIGLTPALRMAVLGVAGDSKLAFIENVAANRGLQARSFSDEAKALAWLNAGR